MSTKIPLKKVRLGSAERANELGKQEGSPALASASGAGRGNVKQGLGFPVSWPPYSASFPGFLPSLFCFLLCLSSAHAALTVIGTQYRMDRLFPEFNCWYGSGSYPTA